MIDNDPDLGQQTHEEEPERREKGPSLPTAPDRQRESNDRLRTTPNRCISDVQAAGLTLVQSPAARAPAQPCA